MVEDGSLSFRPLIVELEEIGQAGENAKALVGVMQAGDAWPLLSKYIRTYTLPYRLHTTLHTQEQEQAQEQWISQCTR